MYIPSFLLFIIYYLYQQMYIDTGCNRRKGPDCGRVFLRSNYNPKHLYPKLNGYRDISQRKEWTSLASAYCTRFRDVILPSL